MTKTLKKIPSRFLWISWTVIITFGLVAMGYGLQNNSNEDFQTSINTANAQALAFCHALQDNNQAIRDILSLLSVDSKVTEDMTPSQKEIIRVANERRKGYRIIAESLFPLSTCVDNYTAKSKRDELLKFLEESAQETSTTVVGTTTTTVPSPGGSP